MVNVVPMRVAYPTVEPAALLPGYDAVEVRTPVARAGVPVAALAVSLPTEAIVETLGGYVDAARIMGCALRLTHEGLPRWPIATWVAVARAATTAGVVVVVDNPPVRGGAVDLWHLLDQLSARSVGCCWNARQAARAWDAPAVAIPTLNSRIRHAVLDAASVAADDPVLRDTVHRLAGIGYDGFVTLEGTQLPDAQVVWQRWQTAPKGVKRTA